MRCHPCAHPISSNLSPRSHPKLSSPSFCSHLSPNPLLLSPVQNPNREISSPLSISPLSQLLLTKISSAAGFLTNPNSHIPFPLGTRPPPTNAVSRSSSQSSLPPRSLRIVTTRCRTQSVPPPPAATPGTARGLSSSYKLSIFIPVFTFCMNVALNRKKALLFCRDSDQIMNQAILTNPS